MTRFVATVLLALASPAFAQQPDLVFPSGASSGRKASRALPALPSRSIAGRTAARAAAKATPKTISARVGRVVGEKVEIRAGKKRTSDVLYTVPAGTNLAILSEEDGYYGVLMVNDTLGWVTRGSLEIVEGYRTNVTLRGAPAKSQPAPKPSGDDVRLDLSGSPEPIQNMIRHAFTWSGVRYVWGGETRNGIDCSAFVRDCYRQMGVELPRVSADQAEVGTEVDWSDLKPGDRLYFDMKRAGRVNHCGIYIGNGYFIHASSNQGKVGVDSLFKSNYYRGLVGARR